jgi:glycosyltransferase involved in cell wall biosynthesis
MVDILMSTYNGEEYLKEQINSILNQTFTDWKLIIRDDCSSDGTVKLIINYCIKYPHKIFLVDQNTENLGYKNSFFRLMDFSTSEYILFSDQDDYWFPNKIEALMLTMNKNEQSTETPTLISSDLIISDESLNIIRESYFKEINFNPSGQQSLLLESRLYGCTFLFNKALLLICKEISDPISRLNQFKINAHDNFISVVCAIVGNIYYVNSPLISHRIHQGNKIGYNEYFKKNFLLQLKILTKYIFDNKAYRELLYKNKTEHIHQIIDSLINVKGLNIQNKFMSFRNIENLNYFHRKYINFRYPFKNHSTFSDQIIYILCY